MIILCILLAVLGGVVVYASERENNIFFQRLYTTCRNFPACDRHPTYAACLIVKKENHHEKIIVTYTMTMNAGNGKVIEAYATLSVSDKIAEMLSDSSTTARVKVQFAVDWLAILQGGVLIEIKEIKLPELKGALIEPAEEV